METKVDFLIRGLWKIHPDAIVDIMFVESDSYTYRKEPM